MAFKTLYLGAYNFTCFCGWSYVLALTLQHLAEGKSILSVYNEVAEVLQIVQSLAILEIIHAMMGVVRSPIFTTFMQVFSRVFIIWTVCYPAPPAQVHWAFTTMVISWSLTEIIRYSFYGLKLIDKVPGFLTYLRYTLFYILYPTGISSELLCTYAAFGFFRETGKWAYEFPKATLPFHWVLVFVAVLYVPGSPMLYNYMRHQRKKVLSGGKKKPRKEGGVLFPKDTKGGRSTTAPGKAALAAAFRNAGEEKAAERVERERNWRFNYNKHYMKMVEVSAKDPAAALSIARGGLDYLYEKFVFITESDETMPFRAALNSTDATFETGEYAGELRAESPRLEVPYHGKMLHGEALAAQVDAWVDYGVIEADAGEALKNVSKNKGWLDLSDRYFVLIGAGSAMGPYSKILAHGGNIIAIDIPRPGVWEKLINKAKNSPGKLYLPLSKKQRSCGSDKEVCEAAGCDLLKNPGQILNWLLSIAPGKPFTIGNYTYLDGGLHVLLSLAADSIISALIEQRPGTSVAFLCTPTDIHIINEEAHRAAKKNMSCHVGRPIEILINLLSGGKHLRKNALPPLDHDLHRVDGLSVAQGPNYALAKRIQHWRAMLAFESGTTVASTVAPSTRTVSVVHNRQFAWAYNGMPYFKPFEIFDQATTNAVMAAMLIHDIQNENSPKNPKNRVKYGIENTLSLFSHNSVHGGVWRCAYQVDSIGLTSVLVHFLGGPKLFVPVFLMVFGAFPAFVYTSLY